MNGLQLADLIGMCGDGGYNQDAATMLRQQHAEIEELKTCLIVEQEHNERIEAILRKAQEK